MPISCKMYKTSWPCVWYMLIWYPHVTVLENVIQCDVHAANLRYLAQANATNKLWPNVVINRKHNQDIQMCTRRILDPTKFSVGFRILLNLKLNRYDSGYYWIEKQLEFQFVLVGFRILLDSNLYCNIYIYMYNI
jgi:hypothetical protein